jgi:uncharacterized protein YndB with AHSA1/START domain
MAARSSGAESRRADARPAGISDAAVHKATGQSWAEWTNLLTAAGAREWSHKEIVAWLAANTKLSGWWQQSVAVGFERATGRRAPGQTADAGFQVGVRATVGAPLEVVWNALTSPAGKKVWLDSDNVILEPNAAYRGRDGSHGEIRVVRPLDRIRFTRRSRGEPADTTVQIALSASGAGKTAITFHHEKLRSTEEREAARRHWKALAERMKEIIEDRRS